MAHTYTKWCDLPRDLLDVVANRLDAPFDTRQMRCVCSWWRSALTNETLDDDDANNNNNNSVIKFLSSDVHYCDLHLAKHTFFLLSPPSNSDSDSDGSGWLIKTEQHIHKPGAFHLYNPFSRTKTNPALNFNLFKVDLTNLRVRELSSEYVLRNAVHNNNDACAQNHLYNMEHEKVAVIKLLPRHHFHENCHNIIVNKNKNAAHSTTVDNNVGDEYAILSTHNTGKLLVYRSTLKEWSILDDWRLGYDDRSIFVNDWSLHYVDVIEFEGVFYAVTNSGRTVAIKVEAKDSPVTVTLLVKSIIGGDKKCLVKSGNDLLMVDVYTCPTPGSRLLKVHAVEIFKLDIHIQRWVLVKTLGDRALFLSNHSCFSAVGLPGCKPNAVYFHFKNFDKDDSCFCDRDARKKSHPGDEFDHQFVWTSDEVGVFDFDEGIIGSLQDSHLFSWPPPPWLTLR